jgi:cation diffusion facilitator CzcD-associated flavoprotein CzcO
MLEWIIVGGGIQGATVATFLLKKGKTTVDQLRIIDPHPKPLENWKRCTSVISMPYLRSPSVHHLDTDPFSLQSFARRENMYEPNTAFYGRYKRPSLNMFNEHCDHLFDHIKLEESYLCNSVTNIQKIQGHWKVTLQNGITLSSKRVVIAIGLSNQLYLPDWARQLKKKQEASVFHIFDKELPPFEELPATFIVIGGGITAAHLAIKLADKYPNQVTMIKRHPFRVHDFDSNPEWLGPKMQRPFRQTEHYGKRRILIKEAHHKGSIPSDILRKIRGLVRTDKLRIVDGAVMDFELSYGEISLLLEKENRVNGRTIILATGFEQILPGKNNSPVLNVVIPS